MSAYAWIHLPQNLYDLAITITILTTTFFLVRIHLRKRVGTSRKQSHNSEAYNNAKDLPGPFAWPVVGNCFQLQKEVHLTLDAWSKQYGSVFKVRLGNYQAVVLNDIDSMKEALVRNRDIYSGRPLFPSNKVVSFGHSVAFHDRTTMPDWYQRKELLVKKVSSFVASVRDRELIEGHIKRDAKFIANTLMERCRLSETGYVDPSRIVEASVGNAISAVCFGRRFAIDDEKFVQLLRVNKEFGEVAGMGNRIDVMPWIKIFPPYAKAAKAFNSLSYRINNWMLDRVKMHISGYDPSKRENLTDSLLHDTWNEKLQQGENSHQKNGQLESGLYLDEFTALLVDVFGAGQDTLSNATIFVFYYMMKHPKVAKRIQEELDRVVGRDRDPCLADRAELVYLQAVMHEILRHSSMSATTIPHRTLENSVLQGYKVPANYLVLLNFYSTNHDPTIWNRPFDFNPDRFLRTSSDGRKELDTSKTTKYIIFSIGARKCPGYDMATYWLTLSFAMLLSKYEFIPDPEHPPTIPQSYGLTLRPVNYRMKLVPRGLHANGNGNHCCHGKAKTV